MKSISDTALWSLIKQGDVKAFNELYERYWQPLYHIVYWRVCDEDAAKDIVQDIFISLWEKRGTIDIRDTVEGYLKVTAKHRVLNFFKAEETRARHYNQAGKTYTTETNSTAETVAAKELTGIYQEEIALLPEKMREIFMLSRQEGLSIEQIATQLSLSPQTVKNQITSALKKMKTRFAGHLNLLVAFGLLFLFWKFS